MKLEGIIFGRLFIFKPKPQLTMKKKQNFQKNLSIRQNIIPPKWGGGRILFGHLFKDSCQPIIQGI